MSCSHPISIKNPVNDDIMYVGCGKCLPCRLHRSIDWRCRIAMEKYSQKAYGSCFCGISYADNYLPENGSCEIKELVKLVKRLRYYLKDDKYLSPNLKYFGVSEYGDETGRCHYHLILLGLNANTARKYLRKAWTKGFITAEPLTPYRIQYVVDYCTVYDPTDEVKDEYILNGLEPPQDIFSRGIGEAYMREFVDEFNEFGYFLVNGTRYTPSPYWIKKLGLVKDSLKARQDLINRSKQLGFDITNPEIAQYEASIKEVALHARQRNKGLATRFASVEIFPPHSSSKVQTIASAINFPLTQEEKEDIPF